MSLHPFHSDRLILNPAGLAGVLTVLHLCMDLKNTLLGKYHYMLFYITAAMNPRMLMTVRGRVWMFPFTVSRKMWGWLCGLLPPLCSRGACVSE